jgi:hypothetical protein
LPDVMENTNGISRFTDTGATNLGQRHHRAWQE